MNKINEVFTMPMSVDEFIEIANNDEIGAREIRCIVHSLNHVDVLADALEAVLPFCQGRTKEQVDAWAAAKDALSEYRGEA